MSSGNPVAEDEQRHDSGEALKRAFLLNASLTVIEIVGGLLTGSLAILADFVHDLGDTFALGLALRSEKAASRGADRRYTYGYRRLSLLASLINATILIAGSLLVITYSLPRLFSEEPPHALGMAGLAVIGLVVNGLAVVSTRKGRTMNEIIVSWHLWEDFLGWLAVLLGAILIYFTGWRWIDPLLAVVIGLFILSQVFGRLREIVRLFLQRTPSGINVGSIREELLASPAIESLHDLHFWSLDGQRNVLTVHAVIAEDSGREDYLRAKAAIRGLKGRYGLDHITAEIEFGDENCPMSD